MIQVNNPEEFRLLIEPFPFLTTEEKNKVVDSVQAFYNFQMYMSEKYGGVRLEIVGARIEMQLAAKLSEKVIRYNDNPAFTGLGDNELTTVLLAESFKEIAHAEGYAHDISEDLTILLSVETKIMENIEQMIKDGREAEVEQIITLMEKIR